VQWKARVDMETGLRRTVEWFRENPDLLEMYSRSIS
jgi:dTDP-D-glucose 4,6-dehydratase